MRTDLVEKNPRGNCLHQEEYSCKKMRVVMIANSFPEQQIMQAEAFSWRRYSEKVAYLKIFKFILRVFRNICGEDELGNFLCYTLR